MENPDPFAQQSLPMSDAVQSHPIVWLHHAGQHLGLVPSLGGGVAAWQIDDPESPQGRQDLWRRWDGASADTVRLASFAMLPWVNRISGGGFAHGGQFHAIRPNRAGEAYPIHGDGWQQAWTIEQPCADTLQMRLRSQHFQGNPHDYEALQSFRLCAAGLEQSLSVRHLGNRPLPYGIGLHPWFPRTPATRISAPVQAIWLCAQDLLPTVHSAQFPPGYDLNQGLSAHGELIDNAYTAWGGLAHIDWPERGLRITVSMPDFEHDGGVERHFCHFYRPTQGPAFCFEPCTHPINAFHLPGLPGLRILGPSQSCAMRVHWHISALRQGVEGL